MAKNSDIIDCSFVYGAGKPAAPVVERDCSFVPPTVPAAAKPAEVAPAAEKPVEHAAQAEPKKPMDPRAKR